MSLAQLHPLSYEELHPGALEPGRYLTDGRRLFRVVSRFTVPPETVLVALEDCATLHITGLVPSELGRMGLTAVPTAEAA